MMMKMARFTNMSKRNKTIWVLKVDGIEYEHKNSLTLIWSLVKIISMNMIFNNMEITKK